MANWPCASLSHSRLFFIILFSWQMPNKKSQKLVWSSLYYGVKSILTFDVIIIKQENNELKIKLLFLLFMNVPCYYSWSVLWFILSHPCNVYVYPSFIATFRKCFVLLMLRWILCNAWRSGEERIELVFSYCKVIHKMRMWLWGNTEGENAQRKTE